MTKNGYVLADHHEKNLDVPPKLLCSTRLGIAILAFFGFMTMNAQRVVMSVAIVCMVNQTWLSELDATLSLPQNGSSMTALYNQSSDTSSVSNDCNFRASSQNVSTSSTSKEGSLLWDRPTQGLVLGSIFYGYMLSQIPGGWLASKFGGRRIMAIFLAILAVSTILTPIGAVVDYRFLIFLRFTSGIGAGISYPCMHAVWGNWAPPLERSRLTAISYAGSQIGNVVSLPLASVLCQYGFAGGWPSIFYVLGGLGLLWIVLWLFLVSDSPSKHKRISEHERAYIVESLKGVAKSESEEKTNNYSVPWVKIFTALPVWAIIFSNITGDWAFYMFETSLPTYLKEVHQFDIQRLGFISSLPYIGFFLVILSAGFVADFIRGRWLSTIATRRLMEGIGKLVLALLIVVLGYLSCHQWMLAVALLTIGVALNGCTFSGYLVNHVDIAPKYAGVLMGISNSIASLAGVAAPYVRGVMTQKGTKDEWQRVFYVTAAVSIIGAVQFFIFARGEVQDWAQTKEEPESKELKQFGEGSAAVDAVVA